MSAMQAALDGFRRWNRFSGVSSRRQFWWFQLFLLLVVVAYLILVAIVAAAAGFELTEDNLNLAMGLLGIFVLIPALSVQVRRLRDAGRGWGWIFLPLIPFIGQLVLLIFFVLPSVERDAPAQEGSAPYVAQKPSLVDTDQVDQIERLSALLDEGRISQAQFEAAKNKLLGL